ARHGRQGPRRDRRRDNGGRGRPALRPRDSRRMAGGPDRRCRGRGGTGRRNRLHRRPADDELGSRDGRDGQGRTGVGKRGGSVTERTAAVLEVQPVHGIPEVSPGTDLGSLLSDTLTDLRDGDVVVVTSKIVSKAEG